MMISWRPAGDPDEARRRVLEATMHHYQMRVEPITGDGWRWSIWICEGAELAVGRANNLTSAKEEVENEFFAIHPIGGHWFEACCTSVKH